MELWTSLPWWIRFPIALGFIAAAIAILMFADPIPLRIVGLLFVIGLVLLYFGPSDSDKQGYKF